MTSAPDDVDRPACPTVRVWRFDEFDWNADGAMPAGADRTATTSRRSSSRRAPPPNPKAWSSVIATCWRTSSRSSARSLKYKKYARPFLPLRFLNLLPLSHMFGQSMATNIPPMVDGTVVFMRSFNPHDIVRIVKTLAHLGDRVRAEDPRRAEGACAAHRPGCRDTCPRHGCRFRKRWWRYRRIHRAVRLEVLGVRRRRRAAAARARRVLEAAGLRRHSGLRADRDGADRHAESSVQDQQRIGGHADRRRRGARSPRTARSWCAARTSPPGITACEGARNRGPKSTPSPGRTLDADGWLHTGDIGENDAEGRVFIKGRKKEMIVTPEGLNVFPDDVERVLNAQPGVASRPSSASVADGQERVHAVLVLEPGPTAEASSARPISTLQDHQRVRSFSVWSERRAAAHRGHARSSSGRRSASGSQPARVPRPRRPSDDPVAALLAQVCRRPRGRRRHVARGSGLSSLERVELMVALEDRLQTRVDESRFAAAQNDRRRQGAARRSRSRQPRSPSRSTFPSWNRRADRRLIRRLSLATWILPLARCFAWIHVRGSRAPANDLNGRSCSRPIIRAISTCRSFSRRMPGHVRKTVAPAMSKEFFKAHFFPEGHPWRQVLAQAAELLPGRVLLQRVPAAAARSRRAADAALHRRGHRATASRS